MLARLDGGHASVELVTANSQVVRAPGRRRPRRRRRRRLAPRHTPNPGIRETELIDDAIVCAVPPEHRWARRRSINREQFVATPMVVRDPSSNARWTVEAVLAAEGLKRRGAAWWRRRRRGRRCRTRAGAVHRSSSAGT